MSDTDDGHEDERLLDATSALLPPLMTAIDALRLAGRHMHPPQLADVVRAAMPYQAPLTDGVAQFEAVDWPRHLGYFSSCALESARSAVRAFQTLETSSESSNPTMAGYSAMRHTTRAVEALYPVASMLPPVSRFYLETQARQDAVVDKLAGVDPQRSEVGVLHAANGTDERGGFTVYVPEYFDPAQPMPLVVALHGGSGHGRNFVWTWLVEARSRGALVLSPTARGDTWSLTGADVDAENINRMLDFVMERWPVDTARVLLTGMSDGGTYSYLLGLQDDARFTHLAPVSASFHPLLIEAASAERLRDLPIYLVHGCLDWMFHVDVARQAADLLAAAGAAVTYREIEDLSHTYPTEENSRILDWLLGNA